MTVLDAISILGAVVGITLLIAWSLERERYKGESPDETARDSDHSGAGGDVRLPDTRGRKRSDSDRKD